MSKSRRNGPKVGGKTRRRRSRTSSSSHLSKAHMDVVSTHISTGDRKGSHRNMVITFLEVLNHVKLYHWKTKQYAEHKATDELYGKLNEDIDKFVEVLLGKDGSRIATVKQIRVCDTIHTTQSLRKKMEKFKDFLMRLNDSLDAHKDSDLLNIRDEILADINQFLYLLTFH